MIGHDCGHLSFSSSHLINDVVGITSLLPMFYPFESWRIKHNLHHNNTNKCVVHSSLTHPTRLEVDNAWQPFQQDYFNQTSSFERSIMILIKGPLWYFASIGHWYVTHPCLYNPSLSRIKEHFFLSTFTPEQQYRVKLSLACVYTAAAIFFPTMLYFVGVWGLGMYYTTCSVANPYLVKYWFIPFLGYHFWVNIVLV